MALGSGQDQDAQPKSGPTLVPPLLPQPTSLFFPLAMYSARVYSPPAMKEFKFEYLHNGLLWCRKNNAKFCIVGLRKIWELPRAARRYRYWFRVSGHKKRGYIRLRFDPWFYSLEIDEVVLNLTYTAYAVLRRLYPPSSQVRYLWVSLFYEEI